MCVLLTKKPASFRSRAASEHVLRQCPRSFKSGATQRGETAVGHGASAANTLGLTTQVPVRQIFLTSGRSRKLKLGTQMIELQEAANARARLPTWLAGRALA